MTLHPFARVSQEESRSVDIFEPKADVCGIKFKSLKSSGFTPKPINC